MINGIIFDMDGVLMNSEKESTRQHIALANRFSVTFSPKELNFFLGIPLIDIWKYAKSKHTIPYSAQELVDMEIAIMKEKFHNGEIKAINGAFEALKNFKSKGYKIGIASSNFDFNIQSALRHNDAADYVDAYTCCKDVKNYKPHPDVFLCCADKLGLNPHECIVIEDSLNGIKGAKAAGMKVIAYVPQEEDEAVCTLSDYVLKDFYDFNEEIIFQFTTN